MTLIRPGEQLPDTIISSVFLAGPIRRCKRPKGDVPWRTEAIKALNCSDRIVVTPEKPDDLPKEELTLQIGWEQKHLNAVDVILMWVPRKQRALPGFTTNIEFGQFLNSGRLFYGRPPETDSTIYMDKRYKEVTGRTPAHSLDDLIDTVVKSLGEGLPRGGPDRYLPQNVHRTPAFVTWRENLAKRGRLLKDANVIAQELTPDNTSGIPISILSVKTQARRGRPRTETETVVIGPESITCPVTIS